MSKEIKLTESQNRVLDQLKDFVDSNRRVFILKGYAGTGKTTLMRFFIRHLTEREVAFELLAPTGRAAKVLSDAVLDDRFEQQQASLVGHTIHSQIFSYSGFNREVKEDELLNANAQGQLSLVFEAVKPERDDNNRDIVYIVDEASMISDSIVNNPTQASFGTGRLLTELLEYDDSPRSKFVFVGDPCQLPPVGDLQSPALREDSFEPKALSASLTEIMRQDNDNSLVNLSKQIRNMASSAPDSTEFYGDRKYWSKLPLRQSSDVALHPSLNEMVHHYVNAVKQQGYEKNIFICHSNKSNKEICTQVRQLLGYSGSLPQQGELLMVIQNNHPTGLVNGDTVRLECIRGPIRSQAGLNFIEARVKDTVYDHSFNTLLLLDTLYTDQLNLPSWQQSNLFIDFFIRMKKQGIRQESAAFEDRMQSDPYLNALRCVFGYSVTCHKAQGGEWDNVYLHLLRNIGLNPTKQTYRWLYTAITRAKQTLHIVNDSLYLT